MIEIPQWLHELQADDLPEQHQKIADAIGYEGLLSLVSAYGGDYLYVPKLDAIIKAVRDKRLLADHRSGMRPAQLAHKYDLSVVQVYEIIKRNRTPQEEGQYSFLDALSV